jgi:hypothetical protein
MKYLLHADTRHSESQAWRSEDEEPIEVLGDQVIWPQGAQPRGEFCGVSGFPPVKKLGLIGENHGKTWDFIGEKYRGTRHF